MPAGAVPVKSACDRLNAAIMLRLILQNFTVDTFFTQLKTANMNTPEVKGNWNLQKSKLKQKFATLTDQDLTYVDGKKDEMFAKLQTKLGKTKEELQKIMDAE